MLDAQTHRRLALAGIKDKDPMVISSAINELRLLGGADAQGALVDILSSASAPDDTKHDAADALFEMGGDAARRFSGLIDKWRTPGDEDDAEVID